MALPALLRLGPPTVDPAEEHRLVDGLRTAGGTGLVLGGLTAGFTARHAAIAVTMVVLGTAAGLPALRRLLPAGTLTARRGLPATILSRGLLTFAFFGGDAYVTLSITTARHRSTVLAGVAVTGATLAWTVGAWTQAHLNERWEGRRLVRIGLVLILVGIAGMAIVLRPEVPIGEGIAAWTVAGLGMGLAYAPISLMMLRDAPLGREGWASASLNLSDVLGTAVGVGLGGAAVAAGSRRGSAITPGLLVAFAVAGAGAVVALVVTSRLPLRGFGVATPISVG
jgi:MFS family permease